MPDLKTLTCPRKWARTRKGFRRWTRSKAFRRLSTVEKMATVIAYNGLKNRVELAA